MWTHSFQVNTGDRAAVLDVTQQINRAISGLGDGLLNVLVPHATAGLAVMETGSGSETDLLDRLDELLPPSAGYVHRHGSPGHGRDHILPAFISSSLVLPVRGGRLDLGTWQSVVIVDTNADNPTRTVRLSFIGG